MASIVSLKILCNEDSGVRICDQINTMMEDKKRQDECILIDWVVESIKDANPSIEDSLQNNTYKQGEFFGPWVIYSTSEQKANPGKGFWSTVYGWTDLNLATRFDGTDFSLPPAIENDAIFRPISDFLNANIP